jgi:hypothetical protein
VFDAAKYSGWYPSRNFDVSPDGQRVLLIKDGPDHDQLTVVERFLEELKGGVPTGR